MAITGTGHQAQQERIYFWLLELNFEPNSDMAALFRRKTRRYWWTAFTDRNGKRIARSAEAEKKDEARDVANTLELEARLETPRSTSN